MKFFVSNQNLQIDYAGFERNLKPSSSHLYASENIENDLMPGNFASSLFARGNIDIVNVRMC